MARVFENDKCNVMEKGLVSVITMTRNREKLLGRCIKSILSQTYTNVEHIIVDGASTDNTSQLVESFGDHRIKYFQLESNWPIRDTLVFAASKASGEYICFLDSDDEYLPTKIEKQVALLSSLPKEYGMVYCWMTYFDESKNKSLIRVHNPQLRGYVALEAAEKPVISGTPIFLFRKSVYDELGGWNWDMPIVTDWELGARYCQKYPTDFVPESLVNVYENHCYVRQTEIILKKRVSYVRRVRMHAFMLDEFKDVFKGHPKYKCHHYSRMTYFSWKDYKFCNALKYGFRWLLCRISLV